VVTDARRRLTLRMGYLAFALRVTLGIGGMFAAPLGAGLPARAVREALTAKS
jgi:hypothetical protein